jgi:hypothetical protein
VTATDPVDTPTAEAAVIAAARAFAAGIRPGSPPQGGSLLGDLFAALDVLDAELARDEPTRLTPTTRALIEDSERLRRERADWHDQADALSRLLRGMARRAGELRRNVAMTHQLYAREFHARERAELAKAGVKGERDAADDTLAWIRRAFGVEDVPGWANELRTRIDAVASRIPTARRSGGPTDPGPRWDLAVSAADAAVSGFSFRQNLGLHHGTRFDIAWGVCAALHAEGLLTEDAPEQGR